MKLYGRLDRFAVLVVLAAMAISRPLLNLLGENAEFFLARRAPKGDIVVVGLVLGLVVPLVFGLVALPRGRVGALLYAAVTFVLAATLVRLFLTVGPLPDWLATVCGVGGGIWLVQALVRYPGARQAARFLLPVPLLFTALFLFFTPTASLLAGEGVVGESGGADRPAPLVMIVFDELPAASLMDVDGDIYRDRFPNFGRLADAGVWFPNAVTVAQQTEHSVPAILTGVVPEGDPTPFAGQYPNNLFTALSESHDLAVYEPLTRLCPAAFCNSTADRSPVAVRAEYLASDIAVVAGHNLLPHFLTGGLPAINSSWGYFGEDLDEYDPVSEFRDAFAQDPRRSLQQAAERIGEGFDGRPPFLFVHALVPHHPWELLPTGQHYEPAIEPTPGATRTGWGPDGWLVQQAMQRHLLNVGYADHALGMILDELDGAGLFEEAMIVVVSDHGISVRPDVENQRALTETSIGEIAAVPILVKLPGVPGGRIDDRRALTIDIVPTVADAMGIDLPWEPEGVSLLGPDPARESTSTKTKADPVTYGADGIEVLAVATRLDGDFPSADLFDVLPTGAPDLLGVQLDHDSLQRSSLVLQRRHPNDFSNVVRGDDEIPVSVAWRIRGDAVGDEIVAVAVNGEVVAVSRAFTEDELIYVQAMIPPDVLRNGDNDIELAVWSAGELRSVETVR